MSFLCFEHACMRKVGSEESERAYESICLRHREGLQAQWPVLVTMRGEIAHW